MKPILLPYQHDSSLLFEKLLELPWPIFLDSCWPFTKQGRFDIISAAPYCRLTTSGQQTQIQDQHRTITSTDDPFAILKEQIAKCTPVAIPEPFSCGAMGYFAYDLARRLEKLPQLAAADITLPDMAIGLYDWCIVVDHHNQSSQLLHTGTTAKEQINYIIDKLQTANCYQRSKPSAVTELRSNLSANQYQQAFKQVKDYLTNGDCYQINLAQRFSVSYKQDSWPLYRLLRAVNPAAFSAYFKIEQGAVLSCSPERFIKVDKGLVETKPIKGTIPRASNQVADQNQIKKLYNSDKDRAENLMIVDLMRNDLGKCCKVNSIAVPKLFAIESFPAIHHLVSTVTGELDSNHHSIDLLRCCFPGGSITGAPKVRAMEIIESLEPNRRSVYCGSIGYINANGNMDTNIAIRTLVHNKQRLHFWAGGGIVYDSSLTTEYQETFDKVALIIKVLTEKY